MVKMALIFRKNNLEHSTAVVELRQRKGFTSIGDPHHASIGKREPHINNHRIIRHD
jgi:hypothetical protein